MSNENLDMFFATANKVTNNLKKASIENTFVNAMNNITHTENGAITFKSSSNALVDFFFHGGALRNERTMNRIYEMFDKAFDEDPTTALRILFYLRDVRGGQGERRVFRELIKWVAIQHPQWLVENLLLIPEYGRWDDLIDLLELDSPIKFPVLTLIIMQLKEDWTNMKNEKSVSLLAKWMPSENASSSKSKRLARMIATHMHISPKKYRFILSTLRAHLDVVERKLSAKNVKAIQYPNVPSKAGLIYKKAFMKHDGERYQRYLDSVDKGEAKINASTLYPYELLEKVWKEGDNQTVNAMWKNLPDYVPGFNGLVVADTSGSMSGRPMAVSVSLAMYIAERNKNEAWKDYFISFSSRPEFHKITGHSLSQRARSVQLGDVANTNLQAVFDMVLQRALMSKVPNEEMPQALIIVSDMEFDSACGENRYGHQTNFEVIRRKYEEAGYTMPTLIFWNVDSRQNQSPVRFDERGVVLLSGCSPVIFKYALGTCKSPMDMVLNVTNSARYSKIIYNQK